MERGIILRSGDIHLLNDDIHLSKDIHLLNYLGFKYWKLTDLGTWK